MSQQVQVEHIFRHEYGKLVALLLRRVGVQHLDAIEDAVQWSMAQALELWPRNNQPQKPAAWLYQVAYRQLLTELRSARRRQTLLAEQYTDTDSQIDEQAEIPLPGEISDSLLRMLFIACHPAIPIESQLVFTLKSLCGFSIKEIALRQFSTEANVYKRFSRARKHLKNQAIELNKLTDADITTRLPSIHHILYLIFTEGYLSSHAQIAIRQELCQEAIRLAFEVTKSPLGNVAETKALLALMHFHLARISARQNDAGNLLLLEQQDRSKWNKQQIAIGMFFLEQSTQCDAISRYHIEAGIAAEHCLSPSFQQTNWQKIATSYQLLAHLAPSPLQQLNLALATAEWQGAKAGLAILQAAESPNWLNNSYHWYAVLADLHFRCGDTNQALDYAKLAIQSTPSKHIRQLLYQRMKKHGMPTIT